MYDIIVSCMSGVCALVCGVSVVLVRSVGMWFVCQAYSVTSRKQQRCMILFREKMTALSLFNDETADLGVRVEMLG